jgi:hypothetical protein
VTRSVEQSEPSELDRIQAFFAEQVQKQRALPKDAALAAQANAIVSAHGRLSPVERLEIYRVQFWLRHTASLVEDFPGVSGILGQAAWQPLVEGYLAAHPPESFTLRQLGLNFPQYIASQRALPQHALCTDMARLELAYLEIFDAADAAPLNADSLAGIPESVWESARIELHPALRVLQLDYPVATLRKQLLQAQFGAEKVLMPAREPQCLLLFRHDLSMIDEQIEPGAFALLQALTRCVPLVEACEQAQTESPEQAAGIAENAGRWFQVWTARGFITGVFPRG